MEIQKNRVYRHFKGDYYLVIDTAVHSNTDEVFVIYRTLYENGELYIKPLEEFLSPVDKVKYPNITQKYRFELQEIPSVNPSHKK